MAYAHGDKQLRTILDFGSGYGRVARYLRAAFPESRVEVTDYSTDGVDWCVDQLGCHRMGDQIPHDYYDLIWVGSVITHLPEAAARDLVGALKRALRPMGVCMITIGGRLALRNLVGFANGQTDNTYQGYGQSVEGAKAIVAGYQAYGYGYHDYPNQRGYGGSLVSPAWLSRHALDNETIELLFQEMGWDTHQDVFAFMRTNGEGMLRIQKGAYY
jgi:SAM-dependent methyltransferase